MTEPRPSGPVSLDETVSSVSKSRPIDQEAAHIFLRLPQQRAPRQLSKLARLFGLETYSSALLGKSVRVELEILALVLTGVFVFELLAWSFFFNGLFAGEVLALGWGTLAAVILALPFAGTILYFERQVITTDTNRLTKKDRRLAQGIRVLAIMGAAFIVAHPVELIAFRIPVTQRLFQVAVDKKEEELKKQLAELAKQSANARKERVESKSELRRLRDDLEAARRDRNHADADSKNFRRQRELLAAELRREREALAEVEDRIDQLIAVDEPVPSSLWRERDRRLTSVESKRLQSQILAGKTTGEAALVENNEERIAELENEAQKLQEEIEQDNQTAERLEKQLRRFEAHANLKIADLRRAGPRGSTAISLDTDEHSDSWPQEWNELLRFQEPEATFFQKLEALYAAIREKTASEGVLNPYLLVFLGIHLAAVFIPSLIFFTKWWLLSNDVNNYYSIEHQAKAGDPTARLMLSVDEQVHQARFDERREL